MRKGFIAILLVTWLLAACTRNDHRPDPVHGVVGNRVVPPYSRNTVVLQLSHGSGLAVPSRVSHVIPDVTIWGNGRVVFTTPDGTIRDGQLDTETVDLLMANANLLHLLQDRYRAIEHDDAPYTIFAIARFGWPKTVSVYGLNPVQSYQGEPHPVEFTTLRHIWAVIHAALPADAPEMAPTEVYITTLSTTDEPTEHWPADLSGHLEGEAAQRAIELAGLREAKSFLVDGKAQQVLVVPIIPRIDNPKVAPAYPQVLIGKAPSTDGVTMSVYAELEAEGGYKLAVAVENRTNQPIEVLYNCGSVLWWEGLRSTPGKDPHSCPPLLPHLIESGRMNVFEERLTPESIEDWSALKAQVGFTRGRGAITPSMIGVKVQAVTP